MISRLEDLGLEVRTVLPQGDVPAWTTVFDARTQPNRQRWFHFWFGAATRGGLDEAHQSVVARLRAGTLDLWETEVSDG
jgi:hypothetical protein